MYCFISYCLKVMLNGNLGKVVSLTVIPAMRSVVSPAEVSKHVANA